MYFGIATIRGTYLERFFVDGVKSSDRWSASPPPVSATFIQRPDELLPELRLPALLPALLPVLAATLLVAFLAATPAAPFAMAFPAARPIALETAFPSAAPHPEVTSANETRATMDRFTGGLPLLKKKRCPKDLPDKYNIAGEVGHVLQVSYRVASHSGSSPISAAVTVSSVVRSSASFRKYALLSPGVGRKQKNGGPTPGGQSTTSIPCADPRGSSKRTRNSCWEL